MKPKYNVFEGADRESSNSLTSDIDHKPLNFLAARPRLSATIVLWLASWIFVTVFSHFATWEQGAQYSHLADLCRWDCTWFGSVLVSGYDKVPSREGGDHANWLFHPLLPIVAYPLNHWLRLSAAASLVLASKAALFLSIYAFLLMISEDGDLDGPDYVRAGALVAFNPYLIYAHAGYSETVYFAALSLAFYFAQRSRWIASGAMGGLVSAARMVGFIFSIPYALFVLRNWRQQSRVRNLTANLIGLLLCPLGTALYMLYLYRHTGDALAQVHIHVAWVGSPPKNPLVVLRECLVARRWPRVWGLMCIGGLLGSAYLLKLKKAEHAVYLLIAVALSLAGGIYGMPRYLWWQPPLLYAIYLWLRRHPFWWTPYLAFASGMASYMIISWFSGHNFVV